MADSGEAFPVRFVIVDNSGSMQSRDGSRLVQTKTGALKSIAATRWAELGDVVVEMAEVCTSISSITHFHLLNRCPLGQFFTVADDGTSCIPSAGAPATCEQMKKVMASSPLGGTPLTEAVQQVVQQIAPAAEKLAAHGQKAVVVLATDGLPNNPQSFLQTLKDLQRLPVWLVVRLCTDQEDVVSYWSDLDKSLEAPLETLDDVAGEAKECHSHNPWLVYAPALHLARTMGLHDKLFDLLDEQPMIPSQAKQLCERIIGCAELPEPDVDPEGFKVALKAALALLPPVYNPIRGTMCPWIDVHALTRITNRGRSSCVIA